MSRARHAQLHLDHNYHIPLGPTLPHIISRHNLQQMTVHAPLPIIAPVIERELTANQRNLVDTCFEEGNYDAAISLMDKLRHPGYKPHE